MKVQLAHLRDQGIDFAVFDSDAKHRTRQARSDLLADLTKRAVASGLRVQKSALAFREGGRVKFFGAPDLVDYLSSLGGVPRWTHTLNV